MSMSEFKGQAYGSEDNFFLDTTPAGGLPDDFSDEEIAFARELDFLFNPAAEELPPYFVQTLLEPEDPRFQAVEVGFEKKTSARVFRRLNLHRRLFRPSPLATQEIRHWIPLRRPLIATTAVASLIMILLMAITAPSFASGLAVLLAGPHFGVIQVHDYPGRFGSSTVHQHVDDSSPAQSHRLSLLDAQQLLHFSMYWPQSNVMPNNYDLKNVYIYEGANRDWADGPVIELDYDYMFPGVTPQAGGHIAICEFKPKGQVLQVVQLGAAHQLQIDAHGNVTALYINGQWTTIDGTSHVWTYSGQNELIYERDGVIFWIAGNQSDGIDDDALLNIASSLQPFDVATATRIGRAYESVIRAQGEAPSLMQGNVFYLDNADDPDGPALMVVGEDNSIQRQSLERMRMQQQNFSFFG